MRIPSFFTRTHKIKKKWISEDDPQAAMVYLMERAFMGQSYNVSQDPEFLGTIAKHACRKRKIEVPPIVIKKQKSVYGSTYEDYILLSTEGGQNLHTLLHELAHWIVDRTYEDVEAHGTEFVQVYGELLEEYNMMPREAYRAMCKKYKVK